MFTSEKIAVPLRMVSKLDFSLHDSVSWRSSSERTVSLVTLMLVNIVTDTSADVPVKSLTRCAGTPKKYVWAPKILMAPTMKSTSVVRWRTKGQVMKSGASWQNA